MTYGSNCQCDNEKQIDPGCCQWSLWRGCWRTDHHRAHLTAVFSPFPHLLPHSKGKRATVCLGVMALCNAMVAVSVGRLKLLVPVWDDHWWLRLWEGALHLEALPLCSVLGPSLPCGISSFLQVFTWTLSTGLYAYLALRILSSFMNVH